MYLKDKNKLIFYTFITIIIIKLISINQIQKNRELPIEPDDSFIYMTHSFLLYEDKLRKNKTWKSIEDFIFTTYENEEINTPKNVTEISKIERVLVTPRYFLYSKIFGFFMKNSKIDKVKLWWIFNYISQILILISSYCLINLFAKNKNYYEKIILLIGSFFLVLSIKHHITATPMTIGSSIYIISLYCILNKSSNFLRYFGFVLNFLSFHFHPGIFLISGIFIGSYFLLYLTIGKKKYFTNFFLLGILAFFAILIEYFLFLQSGLRYLGIFETSYVGQSFSKINGFFNIFEFNWTATKSRFAGMLYPILPFFLHKKNLAFIIYLCSLFVAFKNHKNLFVLNIFCIILIIIGCFYFLSMKHPGNVIFYTANVIIPIILITIYNMYFEITKKLQATFKFKKNYLLFLLVLIIFVNNSFSYQKVLDARKNDENYENIESELIEFKKSQIKKSGDAIIIGDDDLLWIFTSVFKDVNIYLADSMRKNDEKWYFKNNHSVKGFIGKIDEKNSQQLMSVYVSGEKFRFNKIKIFKNFYFLYN